VVGAVGADDEEDPHAVADNTAEATANAAAERFRQRVTPHYLAAGRIRKPA